MPFSSSDSITLAATVYINIQIATRVSYLHIVDCHSHQYCVLKFSEWHIRALYMHD